MLNEITKKINCNEYLNSLDCWYGVRLNGEEYYTAYWFMKDSDGISSVPYAGDLEQGVRIGAFETKESAIEKIKLSAAPDKAIVLYERESSEVGSDLYFSFTPQEIIKAA